ncbi:MAG: helix-turn-helix domain-containing protein [Candidatus Daviesbacteria bacterium]|nr:helix-turn-helix domain-containing protein [Candidatus Daviesbacteria bacterium]
MRTVGQVLKEKREKELYTLDEIEKATKIRKELLEALEAGQYLKLPPLTFIQGFIKSYGKFLKLDTEKLLALFRREFSEGNHPPRIMDSFSNPFFEKRFRLTPARALGGLILGLVIIFFVYLWIQYRFLVGGPFLEVSQPVNQFTTDSATVQVIGRTDPEVNLSINNQGIGVDVTGKFSQEIKLSDNMNTIEIVATSKTGKTTKIERTVFLKK